jgi:uncharacterized protein
MSSSALKIEPAVKAQEPSMEEILASIRKIISDDDSRGASPVQKAAPASPAEDAPRGQDDIDALLADFEQPQGESEVLELTEEMAAPTERIEGTDLDFIESGPLPDIADDHSQSEPPPTAQQLDRNEGRDRRGDRPAARVEAPSAPRYDERLISSATDSAISAAFGDLTHTILSQNARTLDDLVQDMLRPMLKAWLDDNLPSLVERLVRAEIERVSRGSR